MTKAFTYSCRDCEGMEACPASIVAETRVELLEMIAHHARIAHKEDADEWDRETRHYLGSLIREVEVNVGVPA